MFKALNVGNYPFLRYLKGLNVLNTLYGECPCKLKLIRCRALAGTPISRKVVKTKSCETEGKAEAKSINIQTPRSCISEVCSHTAIVPKSLARRRMAKHVLQAWLSTTVVAGATPRDELYVLQGCDRFTHNLHPSGDRGCLRHPR